MTVLRPKSRDAIVEAAFLVFYQSPGASLADVASKAGVGRATLHRHFPGRADLIRALSVCANDELNQAVDEATVNSQTATDALYAALCAMVPLASRQWFLAQNWQDADPDVAAAYESSLRELGETLDAAKSEGFFASNVPTAWLVEAYENLLCAAWSLVRSGEATPKQAADLAWRTLTNGLSGDAS